MASSTKAYMTQTSFTASNVDLVSATSTWWKDQELGSYTPAITCNTDTNGVQIIKDTDANYTNGKIDYSTIYFNPITESDIANDQTLQFHVIMHELGHVYGMGHTKPSNSLMYVNINYATSLSAYDRSVMNSFYN